MNDKGLRTRRATLLTASSVILGIAVVAVAAWVLREVVVETWYLHQLETGTEPERGKAAKRLAELRSARAVPILIRELPRVVELESPWDHYVCVTLREIGPRAAPALIAVLRDSTRPFRVRRVASGAIGSTVETAKRAVPELARALADDDEGTKMLACAAIARFRRHGSIAAPGLEQLLLDERRHVRSLVALTLVGMGAGGPRVIPALCEHLETGELFIEPGKVVTPRWVGQRAAGALGKLGRVAPGRRCPLAVY